MTTTRASQTGPAHRADRPGAAAGRPGGHRRARRDGLDRRHRLRRDHGDGAGTRPGVPSRRAAWAGVLGDARPGHARRRRRRAGRGLVRARHPGRAARDARGRRALPGPGRRMGGAAHRHGDRAGGALRRRGRRVPDPRAQRLRRARVRLVGARDRGRALPVPRRRVALAVDARAAAAAPLAQARRGHAGDRADGRGRRGPAPGPHAGPPPRRARAARGVDGRMRVVAVAAPGRRPARAAARRHRRGGHGARPAARLGRPRRAEPPARTSTSADSRGSRSSSWSSSPWPPCCPPPRAACWPWFSERS